MSTQEKNMNTKDIIIVSVCTLVIFISGMFAGYMVPKCHGPRHHQGFQHERMMDKGCPCAKKMMDGEKGFGCDKMNSDCGCDKAKGEFSGDKMKNGPRGEGRGEGRGSRPAPENAPRPEMPKK